MTVLRALATAGSFLGGRILQLGTGIVLARVFGPVAWGGAGTIRAAFELVIIFLRGGSEQVLFKYAAGLDREAASRVASGVWHSASKLCLLLSMAVSILLMASGAGAMEMSHWWLAVLVFSASVPLLTFSQTASSLSMALGRNNLLHMENLVLPATRFVVALVLVRVFPALEALVTSFLVASLLLAFLCVWRGPVQGWWRRPAAPQRANVIEFVSLGSNYVLSAMVSRLDLLMVGLMVGMAVAGNYSILHSIAGTISVVGATHGRILSPKLGNLLRERLVKEALSMVGVARRWTLSVVIPAVVTVGCGAHIVVAILGEGYKIDPAATWLVAGAYGVAATFNYSGLLLSLSGLQRLERNSLYLGGATLVLCGLILVPVLGMKGGSLACLASVLVMTVSREILVIRAYRARAKALTPVNTLELLALLVPGLLVVLVQIWGGMDSPLETLALLAGYGVVHAASVYFFFMNASERKLLAGLISRVRQCA